MAIETEYEPVADLDDLREEGRTIARAGDHSIALFHHEGEVYAVDNRCPHMGFPLSKGTVENGILTCHWHHARFELACGDTFDIWADDVQTFPTDVRDGQVYVDPDPEPDVPPATHWRNRLVDGMQENLNLVMAKAVISLHDEGEGFHIPLETAINFGTKYRSMGWGRGLTTLGVMANLYSDVTGEDKRRAIFMGVREVADNCAGEPPWFEQYALENTELSKDRLKSWFRETCEVRDDDGAERCLRTAIAALSPADVAEIVFSAATDHLYMNASHTLDFLNKAFETLDHVGWEQAPTVLPTTIRQITEGTRSEELSEWRQPIDVARLCFDAADHLPELVAAGEGKEWERPDGFVDTLLSDDPQGIMDALTGAIQEGAASEQLADAVFAAATRRVAQFSTSNEFNDWNTVHHTFSYANAVHAATQRTDATELYRGCFDGAMSVYLDRFLNQPPAPLPEPSGSDRDPAAIREELLATFDEQGRVQEAGDLVSEHFDAAGEPTALKGTLGEGLLREDAGFHTLQSVEIGFRRFDHVDGDRERRLALVAPARYLAAHFPTRREAEQTYTIAARLHRGEKVHEA